MHTSRFAIYNISWRVCFQNRVIPVCRFVSVSFFGLHSILQLETASKPSYLMHGPGHYVIRWDKEKHQRFQPNYLGFVPYWKASFILFCLLCLWQSNYIWTMEISVLQYNNKGPIPFRILKSYLGRYCHTKQPSDLISFMEINYSFFIV